MADETVGLKLDVTGEESAKRAAVAVGGLETSIKSAAVATHQLDTAMVGFGRGMDMGRIGMGVNQLVQGLEDLQYSIGGAMNNLGSAAMMFGASGMFVAGFTAAGIAVNQLVKHWDDLKKVFDDTEPIDKTIERLEKFAKNADKVAEASNVAAGLTPSGGPTTGEALDIDNKTQDALGELMQRDAVIQSIDRERAEINDRMEKARQKAIAEHRQWFGAESTQAGAERYAATQVKDESAAIARLNEAREKRRVELEGIASKQVGEAAKLEPGIDPMQGEMDMARKRAEFEEEEREKDRQFEEDLQKAELDAARKRGEAEAEAYEEKRKQGLLSEQLDAAAMEDEVLAARKRGEAEAEAQLNDPYQQLKDRRNAGRMQGRDAMLDMQRLQLEWLENNDPAGARMMRGQMAAQARMNDPGAIGNMAARQAALRMSGGGGSLQGAAARAAKNQSIAERMQKATMTFEEAVKKLADGNIQVVM